MADETAQQREDRLNRAAALIAGKQMAFRNSLSERTARKAQIEADNAEIQRRALAIVDGSRPAVTSASASSSRSHPTAAPVAKPDDKAKIAELWKRSMKAAASGPCETFEPD